MPSVRYYNQTAPFWDFVASLEDRGSNHAFFADRQGQDNDNGGEGPGTWGGWNPWGAAHPYRTRGPHGPHGHHNPPPRPDGETPPPPPGEDGPSDPAPPHNPNEDDPSPPQPPHHPHRGGCRRGHGRGRGGWGAWGGPFGRGGPFGGGRGGGFGNPLAFEALANFINGQLNPEEAAAAGGERGGGQEDFKPDADVFDTETTFEIHVSLPGANKEDVGVSWDAEKSELNVAGVVHRPGDEDFLKTLAMGERKVGAFERKIRLGSRANPAQVDADMITAKLEDGVLRVTVPKLDKDFVEVKKIDIE